MVRNGLLSTALAGMIGLGLVGGSVFTAGKLVDRKHADAGVALAQHRAVQLTHELDDWRQVDPGSLADLDSAREARRTLDMLRQLYEQEERLWSYYAALEQSAKTRRHLIEEQQRRERARRLPPAALTTPVRPRSPASAGERRRHLFSEGR